MRANQFLFLFGLGVLAVSLSCSSLQTSHVELAQDSYVTVGNEEASLHKKGESLALPDEKPLLIESPGKIGVLVLPQRGNATNTKITLKATDQWAGPFVQNRIDKSLDELVSYINEVQVLLSKRRLGEAQAAIQFMKKRYPKVEQLKFLEASFLVASGEKVKAAHVLADFITTHPDDQPAKEFLVSLTKSFKPVSESGAEPKSRIPASEEEEEQDNDQD